MKFKIGMIVAFGLASISTMAAELSDISNYREY